MKKTIGYIGLGKMGKGMAEHLLEKGWEVVAFNRTPTPTDELAKVGAVATYTIAEIVSKLEAPLK